MTAPNILSTYIASSTGSVNAYVSELVASFGHGFEGLGCQLDRKGCEPMSTVQTHNNRARTTVLPLRKEHDASKPHIPHHCISFVESHPCPSPPTVHPDYEKKLGSRSQSSSAELSSSRASTASTQTSSASHQAGRRSPEPVALSLRAKHSSLRNQARQDAHIQSARLLRVRLESRQKHDQSVQRECLTIAGAGRYSRSPIAI